MIAYLEGIVRLVRKDRIIVQAGPIGFDVYVLNPSVWRKEQTVSLFCYQQFREDGQSLFGFEKEEMYELFTLLIQVKGLGCKSVMNMLSAMPCETIIRAIEQADAATLKKLPGIGAKTAGQIILDLKGKIVCEPDAPQNPTLFTGPWKEVEEALESLGYKQAEIAWLGEEFAKRDDLQVDEMLRMALKRLSGKLHFQTN